MFSVLAQATAGELALSAGGGAIVAGIVTVAVAAIKRGGKIVVGPENGKANGKVAQVVCPAHHEFAAKLDERHVAIKEALASLAQSQERQEQTLLDAINDVKKSVSLLS